MPDETSPDIPTYSPETPPTPSPKTPEQTRLNEAREKALKYADTKLDFNGVDGKPLPLDISLNQIGIVRDEAEHILAGNPTDPAAKEQGEFLLLSSIEAEFKLINNLEDGTGLMDALTKFHARNRLTSTDTTERLTNTPISEYPSSGEPSTPTTPQTQS